MLEQPRGVGVMVVLGGECSAEPDPRGRVAPDEDCQQLAEMGVRRISLGSSLSRAALGALMRAAQEISKHGTFTFAGDAMSSAEANGLMTEPPPEKAGP